MAPTAIASRPAKRSGSSASKPARSRPSPSKRRNVASGVSVNTATATTAIGSAVIPEAGRPAYVGRFAPSPTGDLHLGSLLAAVGSYLDARHHGGRWLVRMEDLDTPRVVPGSAGRILRTLEGFGLEWDGEVLYQSRRIPLYLDTLERLRAAGHTFNCSCTRRQLGGQEDSAYPGTCRNGPTRSGVPTSLRFRLAHGFVVLFDDRVQ